MAARPLSRVSAGMRETPGTGAPAGSGFTAFSNMVTAGVATRIEASVKPDVRVVLSFVFFKAVEETGDRYRRVPG